MKPNNRECENNDCLKPWIIRTELTDSQAVDFFQSQYTVNNNPEKLYQKKRLRQRVLNILQELGERERTIILLRFYAGCTLNECGEIFKITKERCFLIERMALRKLGQKFEQKKIGL